MKASFAILSVALLLTLTAAGAQRPPAGFKVGQPFPNLVLPSLKDGRPVSIAQFRGKKLILHIFASW